DGRGRVICRRLVFAGAPEGGPRVSDATNPRAASPSGSRGGRPRRRGDAPRRGPRAGAPFLLLPLAACCTPSAKGMPQLRQWSFALPCVSEGVEFAHGPPVT